VSCKVDATPEQIEAAKMNAIELGGKIGYEYSIIKAFSVSFEKDVITTLESHEHVKSVTKEGVMRRQ
ncbi:hypothetical protein B0J13DRAFT_458573, partial [Dactylonectria estremocensis]